MDQIIQHLISSEHLLIVSHAHMDGDAVGSLLATGLAMALALSLGIALALLSWSLLWPAARFMSTDLEVQLMSVTYLKIRLLGGPAVLLTTACFGALRGVQDMRTPLWIAVGANAANVILDALLIFGAGPIPALGVAGGTWLVTRHGMPGSPFLVALATCMLSRLILGGAGGRGQHAGNGGDDRLRRGPRGGVHSGANSRNDLVSTQGCGDTARRRVM